MGVLIPVEPTVYVERVPSHTSCAWKAGSLDRVADWIARESDERDPLVAFDAASVAGRQRASVSTLAATDGVQYVRFDSPAGWRVTWERRTTPVVTIDGAVTPDRCRRLHRATTDCTEWPVDATTRLADLLDEPP